MPFVRTPSYTFEHAQPLTDPVRAVAEGAENAVARNLLHAWTSARFDANRPVSELVAGLVADLYPVERQIVQTFTCGRVAMMRQIMAGPKSGSIAKAIPQIGIGFEMLPPQTEAQAQATAGQLVREIGDDLRATINATVTDGLNQGLGPEEIAANVRNGLGLTASQARAVANYRRALLARSPQALGYGLRDRRFDPTVERAIASDAPLTPEQIDNYVGAYRRRYLSYRANTIARYETLNASNAGALAELKNAVGDGRMPKGTKKRWLIAHDELTCPACRSIPRLQPHGVALDADFQWEEEARSGSVSVPALHPNCFPGDTLIAPGQRITGALQRHYEGDIWVITTASGEKLPVTGEHPILTRRGWMPAKFLQAGDELLRCLGAPGPFPGAANNHDEHVPAAASQIWNTLARPGYMATREMPLATINLDSDVPYRDIDIVSALGLLMDRGIPRRSQLTGDEAFERVHAGSSFSFFGCQDESLFGRNVAHPMGRCDLGFSLGHGHLLPFDPFLISPASAFDAGLVQSSKDRRTADIELARQLYDGRAGPVAADKITDIDIQSFSGHVFNLETEGSYYIAQGMLVHNCRCTVTFGVL